MLFGLVGRDPKGLRLALLLFVAFLPAAILGVLFDDWIEARLFFAGPVLLALALGGVYMIVLDLWQKRRHREHPDAETPDITDLTFAQAVIIGLLQCVAMWPGTSRSMMTITGGILVGLRPRQAAEFSFLLGLPTLGGATVYKLAKNLKEAHDTGGDNLFEQLGVLPVAIGLVVATISAAIAVKWLVSFLNRHGLAIFGYYRLVLCAVLGAAILLGYVSIGPSQ
jgi:undecaprenyl-diphosphatase